MTWQSLAVNSSTIAARSSIAIARPDACDSRPLESFAIRLGAVSAKLTAALAAAWPSVLALAIADRLCELAVIAVCWAGVGAVSGPKLGPVLSPHADTSTAIVVIRTS